MKDMNRDELIELVATVTLRIYAFDYAINAFRHVFHLQHYLSVIPTSNYTITGYVEDIAYDTLLSAVFFLLTAPLARLLCRGLSKALPPESTA